MKRRPLIALLLALLALSFTARAESDDPVVVRVGDFSYSKSVAEFAMRSTLDVVSILNGEVTDAQARSVRDQTLERLVGIGVIENKLTELGLNDFTEDEQELLMSQARSQYEATWQAIFAELRKQDADVTEADVTGWMDDEGYTVDAFYREAVVSERQFRMLERYCADVTVTEDEVEQFYLENYVEPEREKYENDLAAFEQDALLDGDETFFVPEGYIYVKQIVLDYPQEFKDALKPYDRRVNSALTKARAAYLALADAAAAAEGWDDIADAKDAYDDAMAQYEAAILSRREKLPEALPLLKGATDEIAERYGAGVLFESLMQTYSVDQTAASADDPGLPLHPDSPNWPEAVRRAASALEKPGDISDPVATEQGVHILRYMGDMPGGAHALTDAEREALNEAALYSARLEALQALLQGWQADYEIEVYPDLIDMD